MRTEGMSGARNTRNPAARTGFRLSWTTSAIADVVQLNRNPVRAAGFRVLRAPDIPSVLIEIGYLSSKNDIDLLTSSDWRDRTSERLAAGIAEFITRTRVNAAQTPAPP